MCNLPVETDVLKDLRALPLDPDEALLRVPDGAGHRGEHAAHQP